MKLRPPGDRLLSRNRQRHLGPRTTRNNHPIVLCLYTLPGINYLLTSSFALLPFLNIEGALKLPKSFFFGFFVSPEGMSGADKLASTSGPCKDDRDGTAKGRGRRPKSVRGGGKRLRRAQIIGAVLSNTCIPSTRFPCGIVDRA